MNIATEISEISPFKRGKSYQFSVTLFTDARVSVQVEVTAAELADFKRFTYAVLNKLGLLVEPRYETNWYSTLKNASSRSQRLQRERAEGKEPQ